MDFLRLDEGCFALKGEQGPSWAPHPQPRTAHPSTVASTAPGPPTREHGCSRGPWRSRAETAVLEGTARDVGGPTQHHNGREGSKSGFLDDTQGVKSYGDLNHEMKRFLTAEE